MPPIRIAFVKFAGLAAGGTEKWLQMMAANLPKDQFSVDYYYCDPAPYLGSTYQHAPNDPHRLKYLNDHQVNLIKFHVGTKDISVSTHDWLDTNFWDYFDPKKYDFVQTAKAGPAEYPYYKMSIPVVEYLTLAAGVDHSPNIAWSIHLSEWQRIHWYKLGGNLYRSCVIPIPAYTPKTAQNFHQQLCLPENALIYGMHQRVDDHIFSSIPLEAFSHINSPNAYFLIMGGSPKYREQAKLLNLKHVRFLEHSANEYVISKFLNTLDIFAHGRHDGETFGTTIAEAMMHGLPIVSHETKYSNAHVETIGPAGYFTHSLNEYTQKMIMLENKDLRTFLGNKAMIHAKKYYSLDTAVDTLSKIYKSLYFNRVFKFSKTSYAFSDIGCLYAGEISNPASLAHHMAIGGTMSGAEIFVFRHFCPWQKVLLDIGSNSGYYPFVSKKYNPHIIVHAYEPQPSCCKDFLQTVSLNNWEDSIFIHQIGISDRSGTMKLFLSGTGSTFIRNLNDDPNLSTISVPIATLDQEVIRLALNNVDFIKIDVEGYEHQVLKGAIKTISRWRPILYLEIITQWKERGFINHNYTKTINWLIKHNYSIFQVNEHDIRQIKPNTSNSVRLTMYLCLPNDKPYLWILLYKAKYFLKLKYVFKRPIYILQLIHQAIKTPRYSLYLIVNKIGLK